MSQQFQKCYAAEGKDVVGQLGSKFTPAVLTKVSSCLQSIICWLDRELKTFGMVRVSTI
jgi:hypothetical protein